MTCAAVVYGVWFCLFLVLLVMLFVCYVVGVVRCLDSVPYAFRCLSLGIIFIPVCSMHHHARMNVMSSLSSSPGGVLMLSRPFERASVSRIFPIICSTCPAL